MLDDIFKLLELANHLEERRETRLEAATKYYEAVYLMKRYVQRIPESASESNARQLLLGKVAHYEARAATLMEDASTAASSSIESPTSSLAVTTTTNPRSPIDKETFFHSESSVVPLPPPTHFPSSTSEVAAGPFSSSSSSSLGSTAAVSPFGAPSDDVTARVGRANRKLAQALDADEAGHTTNALKVYLEAADLYLQALQQLNGGGADHNHNVENSRKVVADVLKRRLQSTLDRIEVLKALQQQQQSQRPSNPPSTGQQQHRSRAAPSTTTNNHSHSSGRSNHSPARPGSAAAITTTPTRALSAEEIAVLKRSSLIASGLFLPWSDDDARALAQSANNTATNSSSAPTLFRDPKGFLPLSPKQKARFHQWARPSEIARARQRAGLTRKVQTVELIRHITPYTIKQQFVTDCSFVAGLCICAAYERRFHKRLVSSLLHPQDADGNPILSPEGKYLVRLWLNGVARSVVIDDCLPIDKLGNLLCSHSSPATNSSYLELWVCLIEKAYMKLCGGYDFPGSNSGVDLFSLTGWIPERVLLPSDPTHVRDFETPTERAWERIASASSYGDCLITVSTERPPTATKASGSSDETVLSETGLVTGHAYAVLSVLQTRNGTRLLQVKNPWGHQGWKGRYSSFDSVRWGDPAFCAEVGYDPRQARLRDDGVFWICWEDVLQHFQNFHLSWNPTLFRYVARSHGLWKREQGPSDDTFNVGENPQYHLSLSERAVKSKATVWILVSRHVDKQEQEGSEAKDFLTVHIHRGTAQGERVWYAGRRGDCILTGAYTNNPHVLVRYDVAGAQDTHLSLVLSQYQKRQDLGYTLSCFCTEDFALGPSAPDLPHRIELKSAWKPGRCGGPLGTPQCHRNPTFAVSIPDAAAAVAALSSGSPGPKVQIRITAPPTLAVNAYMVPVSKWGDAFPQSSSSWPIAVVDSGQYRHGFVATIPARIPPGPYVLLVSGYTPGVTGPLELVLATTSDKIQVKELP